MTKAILAFVCLGLLLPSSIHAATNTYYISTAGSDSNDGLSSGTAWRTFAHANTAMALGTSGAVVHVAGGTYTETIVTSKTGTASAPITYISDTKWGAKLTAPSGTVATWTSNGDYTTIQNFEVSGPACRGILNEGGHQTTIGNNVHNDAVGCDNGSNASGIGSGAGLNDSNYAKCCNSHYGNFVHDVGMVNTSCQNHTNQTVHGIYSGIVGPGVIDNNIVLRNCDNGIDLAHVASNYQITNNTAIYNREGINIEVGGDPCGVSQTCVLTNVKVYNNIAAYNYHWGYIIDATGPGASVGSGNQFAYDLGYGNATGDFDPYGSAGGVVCSPGCITGKSPVFANNTGTASGDYHIQATSPAINTGTATNAPATDFDGAARPQGGGYDIGSYEYHVASAPPLPPTLTSVVVH